MRIKFKKGDPRAGQIVELDEAAAKRAIAAGEAEEVSGKSARTAGDRLSEERGWGTRTGTNEDQAADTVAGAEGAGEGPAPRRARAQAPAPATEAARAPAKKAAAKRSSK
jgi:hypothetical protein